MPHARSDCGYGLSGLHQMRRKRVPQVMEPEPWEAGALRDIAERLLEFTQDEGRPVGAGKEEPVRGDAGAALGKAGLKIRDVPTEQLDGGLVEVDRLPGHG